MCGIRGVARVWAWVVISSAAACCLDRSVGTSTPLPSRRSVPPQILLEPPPALQLVREERVAMTAPQVSRGPRLAPRWQAPGRPGGAGGATHGRDRGARRRGVLCRSGRARPGGRHRARDRVRRGRGAPHRRPATTVRHARIARPGGDPRRRVATPPPAPRRSHAAARRRSGVPLLGRASSGSQRRRGQGLERVRAARRSIDEASRAPVCQRALHAAREGARRSRTPAALSPALAPEIFDEPADVLGAGHRVLRLLLCMRVWVVVGGVSPRPQALEVSCDLDVESSMRGE